MSSSLTAYIVILIIISILLVIFSVASRIMLMLAVGADAKALMLKNRTMWMVLTVFIPVCALIYLALRNQQEKTVPKMCTSCGATLPSNATFCNNCGNNAVVYYQVPEDTKAIQQRKVFLILGIVFYVLTILASIGTSVASYVYTYNQTRHYNDYYDYDYDYDYDDYYDDFFEDYN